MKIYESIKKYGAVPVACGLLPCGSMVAFASDSKSVVTSADWAPVIDSMTAQINVATVVAVLAVIVSAGIGLVFMWWGVRHATSSLMAAFRNGKLSFGGGGRRRR